MKKVACVVLCLSAVGLSVAACNGGGPDAVTRDFLSADGKVFLNDGKTPIQNLPISLYQWTINYKDGSQVTVPFDLTNASIAGSPASIMTDATGDFNFQSDQLQLQSGLQVQACNSVCTDYAQGEDDYCTDWVDSYQDYCANWTSGGQTCSPGSSGTGSTGTGSTGTGSTGTCTSNGEVCSDWETQVVSTCDDWTTEYYSYCDNYVQDCGLVYPDRDVTDIKSAFSEITYLNGTSTVTTQSDGTTLATDASTVSSKTAADGTIESIWHQVDHYTTPFIAQIQVSAANQAAPSAKIQASRMAFTAQHNAAVHPAAQAKHAGIYLGLSKDSGKIGNRHTHPTCSFIPYEAASAAQKAKVEAVRSAHGAVPAGL